MKKIILQALVVSASILSTVLVFSMVFNWYGNSIQIGAIKEAEKDSNGSTSAGKTDTLGTALTTSSSSSSSSSNTIQLSVKEVYRWMSSSSGTINPTLKVS